MPLFPLGSFANSNGNSEFWLQRVCENLRQALHSSGIRQETVNGVPLHFGTVDSSTRTGKCQTFSAVAHAALLAALAFAIVRAPVHGPLGPAVPLGPVRNLLPYIPPLNPQSTGEEGSLGSNGGGGENDPRPTRIGELAPGSSRPLVPPRLTHDENSALPEPPAVFDPNAPANVPVVSHLGLPWMSNDTDSAGPGKGHGFGSGSGESMGDGEGSGAGDGEGGGYVNVASPVTCLYCPEPGYTEEARKAKLEGKMLVRVLVGEDGRAQRIQILQGLGMGLDERTEETIRSWRFAPGRDAAKRPVPTWVTIESRFQLF